MNPARPHRRLVALSALLLVTLLAGVGCGGRRVVTSPEVPRPTKPPARVHHVVERGQTLWRIARAYGVPIETIVAANDLADPTQIEVGQRLLIPGARELIRVAPAPSMVEGRNRETANAPRATSPAGPKTWLWPADGPITSRFGARRRNHRHQGLDIGAKTGSIVRASRAGQVTFAGTRGAYGRLVVIAHADGFSTWYAHNQSLAVRTGQRVRQGETIARVGRSGNASGPHVHFEIRRRGKALDPQLFLP